MATTNSTPHSNTRAVKALTHTTRRGIITSLAQGHNTPNDIARHLGQQLGVVAYHVRQLRDYGVIEEFETRPVRGALQHRYRFTDGAVAEFERVRDLAGEAIRCARQGAPS